MHKHYSSIEQTFIMVKPDGVARGLVGKIYQKLEEMGLKLVAARMIKPSKELAKGNYPGTEVWLIGMGNKTLSNYNNNFDAVKKDMGTVDPLEIGEKVFASLVDYISSGPVIISVWEGNHAVERVKKLAGRTDPTIADVGTIRNTFGFDTPQLAVRSGRIAFKNIMHISDGVDEAKREIRHWFGGKFKDLSGYERVDYVDML